MPGNIDLQGGFDGGRISIKGSINAKGTSLQVNSEGPDVSVLGPYVRLPVPAGGPYVMNSKASTQRNGFKVEVTSLKVSVVPSSNETYSNRWNGSESDSQRSWSDRS